MIWSHVDDLWSLLEIGGGKEDVLVLALANTETAVSNRLESEKQNNTRDNPQ